MKPLKLILLILGISAMLNVTKGFGQQLKQIGTFTDQKYPVYHLGYNLQSTPDGNFLMFRGGNFQQYASVKTFTGVPDLSNYNGLHTESSGLSLPSVDQLPTIEGWNVCYCYDPIWNVVGHGLCKQGLDYSAYKDDPNLRLFKTAKAAEKQIVTKPATNPVGPIPSKPTTEPQQTGVFYNPSFPNYNKVPGTQVLSDWWRGWVGYSYGSDYWELARQMSDGEAHFEFYGQNANYPVPRRTNTGPAPINGLVQIDLPTHSTTTEWHAVKTYRTISKVRMELFDQYGNLIWRLFDTKGGFHPLDSGINSHRGNNHSDPGKRLLIPGVYTLKYWNLNDPKETGVQTQRFEFLKNGENKEVDSNGKVQTWVLNHRGELIKGMRLIEPGEFFEIKLDITDGSGYYKGNCNLTSSLN